MESNEASAKNPEHKEKKMATGEQINRVKDIQRIVGVVSDGKPGPLTKAAVARLFQSVNFNGEYSESLKDEYQALFDLTRIVEARQKEVKQLVAKIHENKERYELLGFDIPWYFIGIIHNLECSLSFGKHLHNGDPLNNRTVRVPKGRPVASEPPYTWEESAKDAIRFKGFDAVTDWSIPHQLYLIEKYNGWGYRLYHPEVLSPYLWSYTNHYTRGKYVADGVWDAEAVSQQVGGAAIIKQLRLNGWV